MSIKIGILGYGNLGRGVEAAVKVNDDTELVAVRAGKRAVSPRLEKIIIGLSGSKEG